jgi:hypothetical protein
MNDLLQFFFLCIIFLLIPLVFPIWFTIGFYAGFLFLGILLLFIFIPFMVGTQRQLEQMIQQLLESWKFSKYFSSFLVWAFSLALDSQNETITVSEQLIHEEMKSENSKNNSKVENTDNCEVKCINRVNPVR